MRKKKELISNSEFARRVECAEGSIRTWILKKKLTQVRCPKTKNMMLDWETQGTIYKELNAVNMAKAKAKASQEKTLNIIESEQKKAHFQALREELRYKKESAELVPYADVVDLLAKINTAFKAKLRATGTKTCQMIVSLDDVKEVRKIIDREHDSALLELSQDLTLGGLIGD